VVEAKKLGLTRAELMHAIEAGWARLNREENLDREEEDR
jgi:hypothetical protein